MDGAEGSRVHAVFDAGFHRRVIEARMQCHDVVPHGGHAQHLHVTAHTITILGHHRVKGEAFRAAVPEHVAHLDHIFVGFGRYGRRQGLVMHAFDGFTGLRMDCQRDAGKQQENDWFQVCHALVRSAEMGELAL